MNFFFNSKLIFGAKSTIQRQKDPTAGAKIFIFNGSSDNLKIDISGPYIGFRESFSILNNPFI